MQLVRIVAMIEKNFQVWKEYISGNALAHLNRGCIPNVGQVFGGSRSFDDSLSSSARWNLVLGSRPARIFVAYVRGGVLFSSTVTRNSGGGQAMATVRTANRLNVDVLLGFQRRLNLREEEWLSPTLKKVATQLRRYSSADEDGVTSSIGMPASEASRFDSGLPPSTKRAAVLVCLYEGAEGELRVILTKRAGRLSTHSGEVALPGGRRDEQDANDEATALREAREEIGLLPSQVRIVATMEPFWSKNSVLVMPVIGLLDDVKEFKPVANPGEVEAIFDAPLEMFLKDENYWFQYRNFTLGKVLVHFFDYTTPQGEKYLVWGLTSAVLIRASSVILERQPAFVEFAGSDLRILKPKSTTKKTP